MALLADSGIDQTEDGTPVLNGIAALVKQGEAAVRLARQMNGPYTSKRLSHAALPGAISTVSRGLWRARLPHRQIPKRLAVQIDHEAAAYLTTKDR